MPITIRGEGSIEGLSAGGLPDGSVTAADIADGVLGVADGSQAGVGGSPFASNTRDLTLRRTNIAFSFQFKPFYNFRTFNTNFGSVYAGPRLRSFNKYFQQSMSASNINWKRVEELRVIGSNTNADGTLLQYGDLSTIAKTYITYPAEVLVPQGKFSNTQKKFSSGIATFDSTA